MILTKLLIILAMVCVSMIPTIAIAKTISHFSVTESATMTEGDKNRSSFFTQTKARGDEDCRPGRSEDDC